MELNVVEFALEASIAMKTLSSNAINRKTKKPCPTIAEIAVHKQLKAVKGWGDLVGLQLQPGERRPAAAAGRKAACSCSREKGGLQLQPEERRPAAAEKGGL